MVFVAFLPLAFSEELLQGLLEAAQATSRITETSRPPWALAVVDGGFLVLILVLTILLWRRTGGWLRSSTLAWWLIGASLTVALDLARDYLLTKKYIAEGGIPLWVDFVTSTAYVLSLAILLAATFKASPIRLLTTSGRQRQLAAWLDFRGTLPLLIGTLAAYIGSGIWDIYLDRAAVRESCFNECKGAINGEYFAQISQVIPLILVGVGLEANFFRRVFTRSTAHAMAIVTVIVLCVGEALAVSALTKANRGDRADVLPGWHEYFAFILTLEAVFVGLATLTWALAVRSNEAGDDAVEVGGSTGQSDELAAEEELAPDLAPSLKGGFTRDRAVLAIGLTALVLSIVAASIKFVRIRRQK